MMVDAALRATVHRLLGDIAPEVDTSTLDPASSLRDQIDLDSMDFLNFVIALGDELQVEVPESDYSQMATLDGCVTYLSSRLPHPSAGAGSLGR